MKKGLIAVDGHGDVQAAPVLVTRLWQHLSLPAATIWAETARIPGPNRPARFEKVARLVRQESPDAFIVLTDEDDRCPAKVAPEMADWLCSSNLPMPGAVVVMHREFETLFLPCLPVLSGQSMVDERGVARPGIRAGTKWGNANFERKRGVKEWLSQHMPAGRIYKETLDQVALTRRLDFDLLEASGLPCFGSLVRALRFLAREMENPSPGTVYPRLGCGSLS